jgi:regulation of enolase protein 1 (concanavalin A-like superfamily)
MSRVLCALAWTVLSCTAFAADPQPEPESPNPFWSGWDKPIDPDKDCKFKREKGGLVIAVPGKDHDLGVERGRMNAPRLLRDVEGDFVAEVRVGGKFAPSDNSTATERVSWLGAGLVLMASEKTYVRLERAALRSDKELKAYANWELRQDGKWELAGTSEVCPLKGKETWLRLQRKGDKVHGFVTEDGKKWTELKALELKLPAKVKRGVAAITTSSDPFSPRFDLFKLRKMKQN